MKMSKRELAMELEKLDALSTKYGNYLNQMYSNLYEPNEDYNSTKVKLNKTVYLIQGIKSNILENAR